MKKVVSLILCLVICLAALPVTALGVVIVDDHTITRVDLNYDESVVVLDPEMTSEQFNTLFQSAITDIEGRPYWLDIDCCELYYKDEETYNQYEEVTIEEGYDYYLMLNLEECSVYNEEEDSWEDYYWDPEQLPEAYVNGTQIPSSQITWWSNNPGATGSVNVFVPISIEQGTYAYDISITPPVAAMKVGTSMDFNAIIGGNDTNVVWSLQKNVSDQTTLSDSGKLTVGSAETDYVLEVKVSPASNPYICAIAEVYVTQSDPYIESVSLSSRNGYSVYVGSDATYLNVSVEGTAFRNVNFTVTGNTSPDTYVTDNNMLIIAEDETASEITVTATSYFDPTKKDSKVFTILQRPLIENLVINYDANRVLPVTGMGVADFNDLMRESMSFPEAGDIYYPDTGYCFLAKYNSENDEYEEISDEDIEDNTQYYFIFNFEEKEGLWNTETLPTATVNGGATEVVRVDWFDGSVSDDGSVDVVIKLPQSSSVTYGDVDGINGITAVDALLVLQASIGAITLSGYDYLAADVDTTSGITAVDSLLILQRSISAIPDFPIERE